MGGWDQLGTWKLGPFFEKKQLMNHLHTIIFFKGTCFLVFRGVTHFGGVPEWNTCRYIGHMILHFPWLMGESRNIIYCSSDFALVWCIWNKWMHIDWYLRKTFNRPVNSSYPSCHSLWNIFFFLDPLHKHVSNKAVRFWYCSCGPCATFFLTDRCKVMTQWYGPDKKKSPAVKDPSMGICFTGLKRFYWFIIPGIRNLSN